VQPARGGFAGLAQSAGRRLQQGYFGDIPYGIVLIGECPRNRHRALQRLLGSLRRWEQIGVCLRCIHAAEPLTKSRELLLKDLEKEKAGNACDKYRRLALLCDKEPQPGMTEWQNAGYLVKFRNALMHFKPAWDHEGIRDSNGKIVDYLKTRISHAYNKPDFPYCLMTYGCAKWAVTSVLNFSQRFSTLLGVKDKFASPSLDFTLP
jgi:hypothetical protein